MTAIIADDDVDAHTLSRADELIGLIGRFRGKYEQSLRHLSYIYYSSGVVAPTADESVALFRHFGGLRASLPWANLGDWPTRVDSLEQLSRDVGGADIWVKREDLSSAIYGGNKVRTLEAIMGEACAAGADYIWATGAYGSNHAVATVLHAGRAGLSSGVALFPQPRSIPARENLSAMLSARPDVINVANVVGLPFVMAHIRRRGQRRGQKHYVMAPGAASPAGAFGAMSAAIELADQVEAGTCPAFKRIVLAVGSTCTTAGILAGIHVAALLGIGFGKPGAPLPTVNAVRVTPWPVTSPARIAWLAYKTAQRLSRLLGEPVDISYRSLRNSLQLITDDYGSGYGMVTARGVRAADAFARAGGPPLDIVYSAKSGAALLDLARATSEPILFWATKSSAPLPSATDGQVGDLPGQVRRWLLDRVL